MTEEKGLDTPRTEAAAELKFYLHGALIGYPHDATERILVGAMEYAVAIEREAAAAPPEPPRPEWQKCPVCDGKGRYMPLYPLPVTDPYVQCHACGGRGMVAAPEGLPLDVVLLDKALTKHGIRLGVATLHMIRDEYDRLSPSSGESVHSDDCYGKTGLSACRCGASSGESDIPGADR